MRNFTIILFIILIVLFLLVFISPKPLALYLSVFSAFLIAVICLNSYLGVLRGIICTFTFIFLPFVLEYFFAKYSIPFALPSLITDWSKNGLYSHINFQTLFFVFSMPTFFICALIFAQKIKLFTGIKTYYNTFLITISSLLMALNFLFFTRQELQYQNATKWLLVALIVNLLLSKLYKFKAETQDIYKELPIIIFLMLYGYNILQNAYPYYLAITVCLSFFYLSLLYNEHQYKKISQST